MSILFGHPTGGPFSHNAALAHYEAGQLEAFCVSWMPSAATVAVLGTLGKFSSLVQRLVRRRFAPLEPAPKVQGRVREWGRLAGRILGFNEQRLVCDANEWLMRIMSHESRRPSVRAVHCYEDCALLPFKEAKRLGKACIYDLPIGYYEAWQRTEANLARCYAEWQPSGFSTSNNQGRLEQKHKEMTLADVVLVPSSFVERTIRDFHPNIHTALVPFGVDTIFWKPPEEKTRSDKLRFVFAGQISIRKGMPCLIEAWRKAALPHAELELVGSWRLAGDRRGNLPSNVIVHPPCSPAVLRERYWAADLLVFPSFFEGLPLVLLEAMACGLPVIATESSAAPDVVSSSCGRVFPAGNVDALVELLRWCNGHRDEIRTMGDAAREQAVTHTWYRYRQLVTQAVSRYCQ